MNIKQCRSAIFNLGLKYGISPDSISKKLLSAEDKRDMISGDLTHDVLDLHVKLWVDGGCQIMIYDKMPQI